MLTREYLKSSADGPLHSNRHLPHFYHKIADLDSSTTFSKFGRRCCFGCTYQHLIQDRGRTAQRAPLRRALHCIVPSRSSAAHVVAQVVVVRKFVAEEAVPWDAFKKLG